ncbi:MAG: CDP-alcohol phosphatidyltransferase family protein [Muribaculaceae bacterium]
MAETETNTSYRDSLKSMDTEEHIDLFFYRPIGYAWARLAAKLGVTPNVITIASIFLGIGAGVAFGYDNFHINLLGIFLLIWANSFDSADGQLARMTKQYSRLGRILDGLSGDIWFFTIYVAICIRENYTSEFFMQYPWFIWVIAIVTGICHAKQAAMADYYRQFHLYFLKGEEGSELETADELKAKLAAIPWKGNFFKKLTLTIYTNYTIQQEATAPNMQVLRKKMAEKYPNGLPQSLRDEFRAASLPLMKYTNILSFNWRTIALFVAILACMPWIYFAFEFVVLNTILIYMIGRHENICKNFIKRIENDEFK